MNSSVTQIISDKYGRHVTSGRKVECPFCNRKTFSIKRDDTLGKCFHPSCSRYITPYLNGGGKYRMFFDLMEGVFKDWHTELLDQKNSPENNVYSYLTLDRQVHPQVVADSMLGAIPANYDIANKFEQAIEKVKGDVESDDESQKDENQTMVEFLEESQAKFLKCLKGTSGWLAFFYTDIYHRVVSIRIRRPSSKQRDILLFKPFKKRTGLFGHGLFSPYESENLKRSNDLLIVTEGEFNQLQLQTLSIRYGESTCSEMGYIYSCAVGGVTNADIEAISKIAKHPIICYDNDFHKAGFKLVKEVRKKVHLTAFTTPVVDTDIDGYIRSFRTDSKAALMAVKSLIANRESYPRYFKEVEKEIIEVRRNNGTNSNRRGFEISDKVAEKIAHDLSGRGKFYNDGMKSYIFIEDKKKLMEIHLDGDDYKLLLARYGINRSEALYKYVFERLYVESLNNGTRTTVHQLAYYESKTYTLYLFNNENQMYRIRPESIDLVDNGTDGVLFPNSSRLDKWEMVETDKQVSLFDEILVSKINSEAKLLSSEERKSVFTLWFYSLFFRSLMPTKPIMAFVGEKGSGKTTTLRKAGMLIYGEKFNVAILPNDPKDFDAAVTNSSFVAFDNADTKCRWLNDRLATVATGGTVKRRVLYTTNELVDVPVDCFLALTSRTPHFKRDDVADRLLIMRVNRIDSFRSERTLLDEVIKNRNHIMTEVVYSLQKVLERYKNEPEAEYSGRFRMADFANFAVKAGAALGIENVEGILDKIIREQSSFLLEDDPVVELLFKWIPDNTDRWVTNSELCKELADLADKIRISFPYKDNSRGFAQRMSNMRTNLALYFNIASKPVGGNRKKFTYSIKDEKTSE